MIAGNRGEQGDKGAKGYGLPGFTGDQGSKGNFIFIRQMCTELLLGFKYERNWVHNVSFAKNRKKLISLKLLSSWNL